MKACFALFIEDNVYICLAIKNILKDSRKEKKSFQENNYVSHQFSIRETGKFGTDQLRDMDRKQWRVSCVLNISVQANVACCR